MALYYVHNNVLYKIKSIVWMSDSSQSQKYRDISSFFPYCRARADIIFVVLIHFFQWFVKFRPSSSISSGTTPNRVSSSVVSRCEKSTTRRPRCLATRWSARRVLPTTSYSRCSSTSSANASALASASPFTKPKSRRPKMRSPKMSVCKKLKYDH